MYRYCQRASRAKTRGWWGGSIIEPCESTVLAEKISSDRETCLKGNIPECKVRFLRFQWRSENCKGPIWILAFTEQLEALLAGSHLSLKDRTDDIEVYLMSLEDVSLVYNVQTTNITKVVSFKRPKEKSN